MKIKTIEITNVKGIGHHVFNLDLSPNKPSILDAPNGFGKSSFSIAFDSLKRDKIELEDNHYQLKNEINRQSHPALRIGGFVLREVRSLWSMVICQCSLGSSGYEAGGVTGCKLPVVGGGVARSADCKLDSYYSL